MFGRIFRVAVLLVGVCGVLLAADLPGVWLDVPFVKQEKDGCGAASIAMVMQYWQAQQGQPANDASDASQIQRTLYSAKAHGIYASDMERYLQEKGFRTFTIRGEWEDLTQHLEKGPCLRFLKPNLADLNCCLHIFFQPCHPGRRPNIGWRISQPRPAAFCRTALAGNRRPRRICTTP